MIDRPAYRLLGAWLTTAVTDGLFACVSALLFGTPVARLWQGVASTLLGKSAYDGGTRTVLIGVLMHFGVALAWSALFLLLATSSARLRDWLRARGDMFTVAAVYGPCIWLVMSLAVIPPLVGRPPAITPRWWIQLIGHAFFVGLPIVAWIAGGVRATSAPDRSYERSR